MKPELINSWLRQNLGTLDLSAHYLGDEPNTFHRDIKDMMRSAGFKVLLASTMPYGASDGNLAIPLLYSMLHHRFPSWAVERAYLPNSRRDIKAMRSAGIPLFSVESKLQFRDFDVVGFSVLNYFAYLHVPWMLHEAGIPLYSLDRDQGDWPIIMMGGSVAGGCEVLAGGRGGVYDLAFLGEADDVLGDVLDAIRRGRVAGQSRHDILRYCAATFPGVYAPRFYDVHHDPGSSAVVSRTKSDPEVPDRVKVVKARNPWVAEAPVVPFSDGINAGCIEISRGCTNSCNFCYESFWYRPYRERSVDSLVYDLARIVRNTGVARVTLMGFSTTDYRHKRKLLKRIRERVSADVGLLAVRPDTYRQDPLFANEIHDAGVSTITLGVEGVSDRIRRKFNKCCTRDDIVEAVKLAIEQGCREVKLFFIANVPGVEDRDFAELIDLLTRINEVRDEVVSRHPDRNKKRCDVALTFTPLIIAPFTPFQWHGTTIDQRTTMPWIPKMQQLGYKFRLGQGARYDASYVDQLLHLGDRRVTPVLVRASQDDTLYFGHIGKGVKRRWDRYLADQGVSFDTYFKPKAQDHVFPWDFIDNGVDRDRLWDQYRQSCADVSSGRRCVEDCYGCGACPPGLLRDRQQAEPDLDDQEFRVKPLRQRLKITKGVRWLRSEAEIDDLHRTIPRAHWATRIRGAAFRNDYEIDKDRISFATDRIEFFNHASGVDYVDVMFCGEVPESRQYVEAMNRELGAGIRFKSAVKLGRNRETPRWRTMGVVSMYEIRFAHSVPDAEARIAAFMARDDIPPDVVMPNRGNGLNVTAAMRQEFARQYPTAFRIAHKSRWGVEQIFIDFRPRVILFDINPVAGVARLIVKGGISPMDAFRRILRIPQRASMGNEVRRVMMLTISEQQDLLAQGCRECGRPIDCTPVGDLIDPERCYRHVVWGS